jgi:uncharacterized membrane protein YphA (DoxX/SURF4 family)
MAVQADAEQPQVARSSGSWSLARRVGFRFCFVYFGLYCLTTQIRSGLFLIPGIYFADLSTFWPMRQIIFWTAAHVFRVKTPLVYRGSGSGDKTFDWVLVFCLLAFALVATVIWSLLDRRREDYRTLYKWFRLFLRFALAGQMILYGMIKVFPVQMPTTSLFQLLEPFGNFSPMGVLWASVGASPAYEIFAGSAELLGGVLLCLPRTTTLGAVICLADMIQVFVLNMSYDVDVKLLSFQLILVSLFLLGPDFRRLANLFLLNRPAPPSNQPALFKTDRANRRAIIAQVLFAIWLLGANAYSASVGWHSRGGSPRSAL